MPSRNIKYTKKQIMLSHNTVGGSIKKYAASGQPLEFLREPFKMRGSN